METLTKSLKRNGFTGLSVSNLRKFRQIPLTWPMLMKFEEYKSGVYRQQYQYKSFLPGKINHEWTWDDPRINALLENATKDLGELNAFTLIVPDVDLYIWMHVIKEANTSSCTGYSFLNRT